MPRHQTNPGAPREERAPRTPSTAPRRAASGAPRRRRLPLRSRSGGMAIASAVLAAVAALALPVADRLIPRTTTGATWGLRIMDASAMDLADAGKFQLWFGGLPVGSVDFSLSLGESRYAGEAHGVGAGLIEALTGARIHAAGEGLLGDPPRAESFTLEASFAGDTQRVDVAYAPPGRPSGVQAEPEWKPRTWQIDPQDQTGTADPVGAAAMLLAPKPPERLCDGSVEVFDGRRRSRIELDAPYPASAGADEGEPGWRCKGRWMRVAGFKPKDMRKEPVPITVEYRAWPDGLARLVSLEAKTGYGMAVARRVESD